MKKPQRPRDTNALAKFIVDLATGEQTETPDKSEDSKNPHAVALGRLGGQKGGKARAENLSKAERVKIAKEGARARWKRAKD